MLLQEGEADFSGINHIKNLHLSDVVQLTEFQSCQIDDALPAYQSRSRSRRAADDNNNNNNEEIFYHPTYIYGLPMMEYLQKDKVKLTRMEPGENNSKRETSSLYPTEAFGIKINPPKSEVNRESWRINLQKEDTERESWDPTARRTDVADHISVPLTDKPQLSEPAPVTPEYTDTKSAQANSNSVEKKAVSAVVTEEQNEDQAPSYYDYYNYHDYDYSTDYLGGGAHYQHGSFGERIDVTDYNTHFGETVEAHKDDNSFPADRMGPPNYSSYPGDVAMYPEEAVVMSGSGNYPQDGMGLASDDDSSMYPGEVMGTRHNDNYPGENVEGVMPPADTLPMNRMGVASSENSEYIAPPGTYFRQSDMGTLAFDRAFFYAVRHNPTGLLLFLGRYLDPEGN